MHTILPLENNSHLREKAHAIAQKDIQSSRIKKLIVKMKKLLSKEEFGVALAAPQVGEPLQLFIVSGRALSRGSRNAKEEPEQNLKTKNEKLATIPDQVYINPVLLKLSRKKEAKHE